jgi:CBS domain-containing protein
MTRRLIPDVVEGQRLLKLPETATVREAAQRMARRNVRSVLVTRGSKLIGIFTGTDLIKKVVAAGLDPNATLLRDVMTRDPDTCSPHENAIQALQRMQERHYRHLPIVDDGKLCGILSRRDFLGYEIEELERREKIGTV